MSSQSPSRNTAPNAIQTPGTERQKRSAIPGATKTFKSAVTAVAYGFLNSTVIAIVFVIACTVPPLFIFISLMVLPEIAKMPSVAEQVEKLEFMRIPAIMTAVVALMYGHSHQKHGTEPLERLVTFFTGPELMIVAATLLAESLLLKARVRGSDCRGRVSWAVGAFALSASLLLGYQAIAKEQSTEAESTVSCHDHVYLSPAAEAKLTAGGKGTFAPECPKLGFREQALLSVHAISKRGDINPSWVALLWLFSFGFSAYVRLLKRSDEHGRAGMTAIGAGGLVDGAPANPVV